MYRTWDWRNAQTRRWVNWRRKDYLNRLDLPPRKSDPQNEANVRWVLSRAWMYTKANRLNKHTFGCKHGICRLQNDETSFVYHKRSFYSELDRYERLKW